MGRPSAASRRRRRVLGSLALVMALAAVWVAAWGLQRWAPFAHATREVTWPANIQPLAEFVEATTHTTFLDPVAVQFDDGSGAYDDLVRVEPLSDDELQLAATQDAVGRALGMWNGDASTAASDEAMGAAPSRAQWLLRGNVLAVDAADGDAELSPMQRLEVVLQLTIALDEQHHHLVQHRIDADTRMQAQAIVAAGLGHAIWVHDQYFTQFSDDDQEAYFDEIDESNDYTLALQLVPPAFTALRLAAQRVGPTFATVLADDGAAALTRALDDVPTALDQALLPVSKYLRRDRTEQASTPAVPTGAQLEFSTQGGPVLLFLMAVTGVAPNEALKAADGWGNDAYTVYRLHDRVCIDMHVVADSRDDADLIEQALEGWASARPDEADALVGRKGTDLYASACDPGVDVEQRVPDEAMIDQLFSRTQMIVRQVEDDVDPVVAECVAVEFFNRYSLVALQSGELEIDVIGEIEALAIDCGAAD